MADDRMEKMVYDFPTEGVLEVQIKGKWFRVTSREFRSFDSNRRYSVPKQQPGLGMPDFILDPFPAAKTIAKF